MGPDQAFRPAPPLARTAVNLANPADSRADEFTNHERCARPVLIESEGSSRQEPCRRQCSFVGIQHAIVIMSMIINGCSRLAPLRAV